LNLSGVPRELRGVTGFAAAAGSRIDRAGLPRVLLSLGVAALAVLAPAAPASAHAAMVAADPVPGSVVPAAPADVTVTFSEPVQVVPGRIQVLAPDGHRIGGPPEVRGAVLRIPLHPADRPLGTYLVSYRVISADTHPVGGALTFSVGAASARPPEAALAAVHRSVALGVPLAHFLGYAGLTLAVGPALLLALLWPRRLARRGAIRLVRAGLGLVGVATAAAFWLQAPDSTGAAAWDVSPGELGDVLDSPFGLVMAARLALLALVWRLLGPALQGRARRGRGLMLAAAALAGLVTWPLAGHPAASPLSAVAVAADVVHLAAASVWLGGLVGLAVFLLPRAHPRVLGVLLPAWSRWAAGAVVWLVAGGVLQALVQVGSAGALWGTGYGRLVLAKVAVLAAVLATAGYARRLAHRAPAAGALRRTVGVEVAGTVLVLAISAVLVQASPGRTAVTARAGAGVSQTLTCPLYVLQFSLYPVELGENNTVHAFVYTPAGAPLPAQEWTVSARLTGRDLEAVSTPMLGLDPPNHALGALTFPLPGTYEIGFTVRTSPVDQATVRTRVTVAATRRNG
jgi:copper transport protein